ncbi:MAG TPA: hypothetical protein DCL15_23825 [Chloroflexi bacterium]|nr:hypothetical protein [Chloroflexota bacterium]HHW87899.1 hypothetical protein [Chloroflexota bacterium]
MASLDAQPSNAGVYQADAEAQASKRTSIGLSAHRPTAPSTVQRPPNAGLALSAWWLVYLLIMLMLAIGILIVARVVAPARTLDDAVNLLLNRPVASTDVIFATDFTDDDGMLRAITIPDQAAVAVLPDTGVYRLDVWPGYLAWSRFTVADVTSLRIDATATIDATTPDAVVALIGRFVDEANYYLFAVDGAGRFRVVRYQAGVAQEVIQPTGASMLNPAGVANRLTLRDDGRVLDFRANDASLAVLPVEATAVAPVGIGAQATNARSVTVTFDEIRVQIP